MLTLLGVLLAIPPSLSNARLRCEFGPRGLVALTDVARHAVYRLTQDEFRLTIGGTSYNSRGLPEPTSTTSRTSPTSITYRWAAGPYHVDVVYELRPAWGFVSKQLFVTGGGAAGYHVDDVTVLDAALAATVRDAYVPRSQHTSLGTGDYGGTLRSAGSRGLLAVVQNPFLEFRRDGNAFAIRYQPDMDWRAEYGPFASDRGLLAPLRLSGRYVPAQMLPEWRLGPADTTPGMDEAEVEAFTEMVRAFLIHPPAHPLNIFVGWTANDYQIDVATPAGQEEYRRVLDRAAGLGARYVLFAPSNSALARREESVDDWSWEHVLWLGLGQKIRKGAWDPATGAMPPSVQALLDYATAKHMKLVAYVYPVLPFAGDAAWLVRAPGDSTRRFASLGVRALQDWLIDKLVAFYRRTGIGGYAFDHTFLTYDGTSRYAQWWGWRRVMVELKRRVPEIVIDGRQAYQNYGPWSWLAGSYPHPTSTDEQPESFVPFPDLSFDRVSADRERYTAYRYRLYEFAPGEIVPGFIGHQTSRGDETGDMPSERTRERGVVLTRFRARDWDYLGWRYSLISSIAIAGWNNVINMIPARDSSENAHFSSADQAWFRHWIAWADTNREYLRHTRPILGQPAIGKLDGTAALAGGRGYVFFFNPNARRLTARLTREELGLEARQFSLRELAPVEEGLGARDWGIGDTISIAVEGESYRVLAIEPSGRGVVAPPATPAAESFNRQIGHVDSGFTGGTFAATFTVPRWVFDQLAARRRAWPIPWTAADSLATWLVPERLLLFVQIAEPDDAWTATLQIDGRPVELEKAYSSIRRVPRDFVGFWADISALAAGESHTLELQLPTLKQRQLQGVFLENVEGAGPLH